MKATFPPVQLKEAVRTALGIVPSRTTKDVLKNIKLTVSGDLATVTANDSESSIEVYIRGIESQKNGTVLLPAAKLSSIIAEMSSPVVLEESAGKATIKSGGAKFVLQTEAPEDFPPTEDFTADSYITISGTVLKRMLKGTVFCCDTTSTRYALAGVYFEFDGKTLLMVATDTKRLALDKAEATKTGEVANVTAADSIIVPQKSLIALERCLSDDPVDIAFCGRKVFFRSGDIAMSCQTVQGRFPDFRRIINNNPTHKIETVAGPFISALRQAMLVTSEETKAIKFAFDKGNLTLSGSAADVGESEVQIPISFDGSSLATMDCTLTIAATKLLDAAQPFTIELIEDEGDGVASRMVFKVADWQCMQMGLR